MSPCQCGDAGAESARTVSSQTSQRAFDRAQHRTGEQYPSSCGWLRACTACRGLPGRTEGGSRGETSMPPKCPPVPISSVHMSVRRTSFCKPKRRRVTTKQLTTPHTTPHKQPGHAVHPRGRHIRERPRAPHPHSTRHVSVTRPSTRAAHYPAHPPRTALTHPASRPWTTTRPTKGWPQET